MLRTTVGTGGVRDPAIIRSPDGGRYWIIATDLHTGGGTSWDDATNRGSTSIAVWESDNLVDWSEPRLLDVAGDIPDAGNAWAPEATARSPSAPATRSWAPGPGSAACRTWA